MSNEKRKRSSARVPARYLEDAEKLNEKFSADIAETEIIKAMGENAALNELIQGMYPDPRGLVN
jgi:hypothetical protein